MQQQAYGIYLLHFIPLIWLQYLVNDPPLPAVVKFAIVFAGTLSTSWVATLGACANSFRRADDLKDENGARPGGGGGEGRGGR